MVTPLAPLCVLKNTVLTMWRHALHILWMAAVRAWLCGGTGAQKNTVLTVSWCAFPSVSTSSGCPLCVQKSTMQTAWRLTLPIL